MARCWGRRVSFSDIFRKENDDRLLLVNFGERQVLHPASEPLLAPPAGLQMGNTLDERVAPLRRSGSRCNRNSGAMDFASRIDGGITAGAQGVDFQPSPSLDG